MMLVDSSVWIDYLSGRPSPQVDELDRVLAGSDLTATCGIVIGEVLQGTGTDADFKSLRKHFESYHYLEATRLTYINAAAIYRLLRGQGITVRKLVDCLIAATAIEHGATLLHKDRDFDPIERHCALKTWRPLS